MSVRTIEVTTDVFAAIWSRRAADEQTESEILARLLGLVQIQVAASRKEGEKLSNKTLWRDDVRRALEVLGGHGHLSEIYRKVREIRLISGRSLPPSTDAIIRRELEYNSSDSESFTGHHDWFRSSRGIGEGDWSLRKVSA
ncbi:MAG: hypothetical protein J7485_09120 [Sphingobium sp.]|nr:hypothetical protein [Sphingobium sp.]